MRCPDTNLMPIKNFSTKMPAMQSVGMAGRCTSTCRRTPTFCWGMVTSLGPATATGQPAIVSYGRNRSALTKVALVRTISNTSVAIAARRVNKEIRPMQGCYWQASTGLRWHVRRLCTKTQDQNKEAPAEGSVGASHRSPPCEHNLTDGQEYKGYK